MKRPLLRAFAAFALLAATVATASAQKFAILTDIHVVPGNANEGKLKEAVAEINGSDADAVIVSGDLTNEGSDVQLKNVHDILAGLKKPYYVIPGNHENNWSQSACKTFADLWGTDRFVFQQDSLLVVGMNCGPFMKMGDGHIKQEDLIWLENTLKSRVKPGMRVLSVNHYPLLDDLDNYADYVALLQKYPVVTHQCGHYHRWRKYATGGIDCVIARALDLGNGNYGYSTISVTPDSVKVYEKLIGQAPAVKYAYKINLNFTPLERPVYADSVPAIFKITKVFADNASIFTRVGLDRNNLYVGNSLGYLKAVDKATGKVRWQYKTGAMLFSRPAVDKKYVVLPTADRRLVWLDKANGAVVYEHDAIGPYVADGVISKGVLYQGGYKTFQAWDVNRHKMLWSYDSINNYCQAAPTISGGDIVFGAWDTYLRVLDKKSGRLRWKWNNGKAQNLFSPGNVVPVVTADKVVIVAPDRYATALDRKSGSVIWREHNDEKVRESLGVSADGKRAYAKTMDGELVAMSTEGNSYQLLWKTDAGFGYEHAPCIVLEHRGLVYLGSRRGVLTVVNALTHKVVFTKHLGSSEINGFEVDDNGDVYCSLIEGTVFRIHTDLI